LDWSDEQSLVRHVERGALGGYDWSMKTINRRTFSHELSTVLDQVIETGEPVRVAGRDGRAVVVSPDTEKESEWDRINRLGLIEPAKEKMDKEFWEEWRQRPKANYDSDWLLAEMEDWR